MKKLALCSFAINHREETLKYLDSFRNTADKWDDIEVLYIDNGSDVPMSEWGLNVPVFRNEVNVGILPAMQQAYEKTTADIILMVHNDVEMFEQGWDTKIKRIFEETGNIGTAGFFSAKGLGTSALYQEPYQMHQLVRQSMVSNCTRMPSGHGHRPLTGEIEKVTMHDGFAMIFNRRFLDENNGFDLHLPPHHMYDAHTALQALDLGYDNYCISMDAYHYGGMTDCNENWEKPFNMTKSEIHQMAHYPYFYEYWRPGTSQASHSVNVHLPIYIN